MVKLTFLILIHILIFCVNNVCSLETPRIVNGNVAEKGQFPWQVGVVGVKSNLLNYCGGAIISEEWILTAAHCIVDTFNITIIYGTLNLDDTTANKATTTKYVIHENFNYQTLTNDIGLVLLDDPVTFNDQIRAVTLTDEVLEPETEITISGWGLTSDNDTNDKHDVLRYITIKTIKNDECIEIYGPDIIQDGIVCTEISSPIKNPCKGDGGDSAVINFDSSPVHVALFSFLSTLGCESTIYPAAFTRTANYRDWIKSISGV